MVIDAVRVISCPLSLCSGPWTPHLRQGCPSPGWLSVNKHERISGLDRCWHARDDFYNAHRRAYTDITCTHVWYLWNNSLHGSALRSPFRNFSANQRLKHWSYSRLSSVQPSPTLFIFTAATNTADCRFSVVFCPRRALGLFRDLARATRHMPIPRGPAWRTMSTSRKKRLKVPRTKLQ